MPYGSNPNGVFRVSLKSDGDKPLNERPWFEFRYLSKFAWGQLVTDVRKKVLQSIEDARADIEKADKTKIWVVDSLDYTNMMVMEGLINWGNQIIPFDKEKIDHICTMPEVDELLQLFKEQGLGQEERKNSG